MVRKPTELSGRNWAPDVWLMIEHALGVLEFERVLERVAGRATSDVGRRQILALRPRYDVDEIERELERVASCMRLIDASPQWTPGPIPDLEEVLTQLGTPGAVLEPIDLFRVGVTLKTGIGLARHLDGVAEDISALEMIRDRMIDDQEVPQIIERSLDDEGCVLSTASDDLDRIRRSLRGARSRIVKRLESLLSSLPDRFVVPDASVTIRDGRFVIPLRREGKGKVGGIVHDESQTGATLYVEPPIAIEATNHLRELEREEAREIRRILRMLTDLLVPHQKELKGLFEALVDFDTLYARAQTAVFWEATPPVINGLAPGTLSLRDARHPLLVESKEGAVIPYDLTLENQERCLVVSGPNTGGKSVFLKATGLITVLTQSGVVPPVGPGTCLPVFESFFADIGDEQSIARNLSTFSAHLENLYSLVSVASDRSLVLIDEMGTGTDPGEGAALSRAVLEELVNRGVTTIVTSHLGELKRLDTKGSHIANASMHFDTERMEPTYRLAKGRPGRSYGLAIARNLGFPAQILDRAESYRDSDEAKLEDVIERVEEQEEEVDRLVLELEEERRRTDRLRVDVESREQTLLELERIAEGRAQADARQLLLDARAEVESVIAELRAAVKGGSDLEQASRIARQKVERSASRHKKLASRVTSKRTDHDQDGVSHEKSEPEELGTEEGARVRIRATGANGRVVERRGDRLLVEVGAMRFELPDEEIESIDFIEEPAAKERAGTWRKPKASHGRLEVDLRGLRVDEMDLELKRAVDEAIRDDLSDLRIIHGMGTGALRKRVSELLAVDTRVQKFRMGGPGDGGAGVTIATFG